MEACVTAAPTPGFSFEAAPTIPVEAKIAAVAASDESLSSASPSAISPQLCDLSALNVAGAKFNPDEKYAIVLVGLPASGKSSLAKQLQAFLRFHVPRYLRYLEDIQEPKFGVKIFNAGSVRRAFNMSVGPGTPKSAELSPILGASGGSVPDWGISAVSLTEATESPPLLSRSASCSSQTQDFFDIKNTQNVQMRDLFAHMALMNMLTYLREPENSVAFFDATNTTKSRRKHVVSEIRQYAAAEKLRINVLVLNTCITNESMHQYHIHEKVSTSPDYRGVANKLLAFLDFTERVERYRAAYELIDEEEIEEWIGEWIGDSNERKWAPVSVVKFENWGENVEWTTPSAGLGDELVMKLISGFLTRYRQINGELFARYEERMVEYMKSEKEFEKALF